MLALPSLVLAISNTVPASFAPPAEVVPNRFPASSAMRLLKGVAPFVPLKLMSVIGRLA